MQMLRSFQEKQAGMESTDTHDNASVDQPPPKKRQKVLLPASCRATTPPNNSNGDYDEKALDEEIESHFQGLPVQILCLMFVLIKVVIKVALTQLCEAVQCPFVTNCRQPTHTTTHKTLFQTFIFPLLII